MKKKSFLVLLAALSSLSACAPDADTVQTVRPPARTFSDGSREAWREYLAVSPLSNNVKPDAGTLGAKAGRPSLEADYARHINHVSEWSTRVDAALQEWGEETARITGSHEAGKTLAELGVPVLYDGLRTHSDDESIVDKIFNKAAEEGLTYLAKLWIEEDRRAQVRAAYQRLVAPLYEEGKRLTYEEQTLNEQIGVESSQRLVTQVKTYRDEDLRRDLVGLWSEKTLGLRTTVWAFYGDGSVAIYHAMGRQTERRGWQVRDAELTLNGHFGAESYRPRRGDGVMVLRAADGSATTLHPESDNPGDFGRLVSQMAANGFRAGGGFRVRIGR